MARTAESKYEESPPPDFENVTASKSKNRSVSAFSQIFSSDLRSLDEPSLPAIPKPPAGFTESIPVLPKPLSASAETSAPPSSNSFTIAVTSLSVAVGKSVVYGTPRKDFEIIVPPTAVILRVAAFAFSALPSVFSMQLR